MFHIQKNEEVLIVLFYKQTLQTLISKVVCSGHILCVVLTHISEVNRPLLIKRKHFKDKTATCQFVIWTIMIVKYTRH